MTLGPSLTLSAQNYTKYLFVYFPSNDNENIYYALSDKESPFDFVPMNNGQMIISADSIALSEGFETLTCCAVKMAGFIW